MFGKKTDKKKKVKNSTKTAATIASQKPISQLTKEDKDKKELQKELKDHNNDDMDEYLYDSLKDNDYLV